MLTLQESYLYQDFKTRCSFRQLHIIFNEYKKKIFFTICTALIIISFIFINFSMLKEDSSFEDLDGKERWGETYNRNFNNKYLVNSKNIFIYFIWCIKGVCYRRNYYYILTIKFYNNCKLNKIITKKVGKIIEVKNSNKNTRR